eukprot:GCRY01004326.1.p1 GENE.GCRY01004326.1~~GCRY01004326.1.p1  ORF type:complete len:380 (-),score=57.87 GCRY01004326.1:222-1361(-)
MLEKSMDNSTPSEENEFSFSSLTSAIIGSYAQDKRFHLIGACTSFPPRQEIQELINILFDVFFPGFWSETVTKDTLNYFVGSRLILLEKLLINQIWHCMRLCDSEMEEFNRVPSNYNVVELEKMAISDSKTKENEDSFSSASSTCSESHFDTKCCYHPCNLQDLNHYREIARNLAQQFLSQISAIRSILMLDAQAAFDGDPAAKSVAEIIYCYPGFYAIAVYRIANALYKLGVPILPRILTEHAHTLTGADLHPHAQIGEAFFIDHASGVVIGQTARIGSHVKIYQGVTLGGLSFPKDANGRAVKGLQRHPTIEDHVTIYANATILGGDTTIGQCSTVAGNVFITSSVDQCSIVQTPPLSRMAEVRPKGQKTPPTKIII